MKKVLFLLLALVMVLSVAACNGGDSPADTGKVENTGGGGGDNTGGGGGGGDDHFVEITVAYESIPNGLCSVSEDIISNISLSNDIYDRLIWVDADMVWHPRVASAWRQVDPLTWEFDINLDYKFSNGDMLTMEDVVYSIERLGSIPKGLEVASFIDSVSYSGNVLTIKTAEVNNTILHRLNGVAIIVNKAYIEAGGEDAQFLHPIGTAPYRVVEFIPGTKVVIETWDGYPFEKPQIDRITFIAIPENANRYIAAETGQIQFASLVTGLEAQLARDNPNIDLLERWGLSIVCLVFQTEKAPFDNVNIRRAITHAIDRDSICALDGGRLPITSILFPGYPDMESEFHPSYPAFDLDEARRLLEAEGYNASNPLKFELTYFRPDPGIEVLQSTLRQIGVEVTLNLVEFSVYLTLEGAGDFDVLWTTQTNRAGSALMDLDRVDEGLIGSRAISRWHNPRVKEIVDRMRATTDNAEINALNAELQKIYAEEVPMPAIMRMPFYSAMAKGMSGVVLRGDRQQIFRFASYNP